MKLTNNCYCIKASCKNVKCERNQEYISELLQTLEKQGKPRGIIIDLKDFTKEKDCKGFLPSRK